MQYNYWVIKATERAIFIYNRLKNIYLYESGLKTFQPLREIRYSVVDSYLLTFQPYWLYNCYVRVEKRPYLVEKENPV